MGHVDGMKRSLVERGIPLGPTGDHLQRLVLATRRDILEAIGGFLVGRSKGDAIACELAISAQASWARNRWLASTPARAGRMTSAAESSLARFWNSTCERMIGSPGRAGLTRR